MEDRYHISPETGRPNKCRASKHPCPFGGPEAHYPTKLEAQRSYEKLMEGAGAAALSGVSKSTQQTKHKKASKKSAESGGPLVPCPQGGRCGSKEHPSGGEAWYKCLEERDRPKSRASMASLAPGASLPEEALSFGFPEEVEDHLLYGGCWRLAEALHREYGYAVVPMWNLNEAVDPEGPADFLNIKIGWGHMMLATPEGRLFDIQGVDQSELAVPPRASRPAQL